MKILLTCILGILIFVGCENDESFMFTNTRYIKFKFGETGEDYYRRLFSFAFEPDTVTRKEITFPVEYRGYNLTENLYFDVKVDEEKTTLPSDCYRLESRQRFQADSGCVDSMRVVLLREPILKENSFILRLSLVSNPDFQVFMMDSLFVEITISDLLSQPDWWNKSVVKSYLGVYSDEKFREFMKETGIRDFGSLDPSAKRHYAIKFKRALEERPRLDGNGSIMSVPIPG